MKLRVKLTPAERKARRYAFWRKARRCWICKGRTSRSLCKRCRQAWNQYQASRYLDRRITGHCTDCGLPSGDASRCVKCTERRATQPSRQPAYRRRRGDGYGGHRSHSKGQAA